MSHDFPIQMPIIVIFHGHVPFPELPPKHGPEPHLLRVRDLRTGFESGMLGDSRPRPRNDEHDEHNEHDEVLTILSLHHPMLCIFDFDPGAAEHTTSFLLLFACCCDPTIRMAQATSPDAVLQTEWTR